LAERLDIKILLDKGRLLREIAKSMERGHNTVAYEVRVNGGIAGQPINCNGGPTSIIGTVPCSHGNYGNLL